MSPATYRCGAEVWAAPDWAVVPAPAARLQRTTCRSCGSPVAWLRTLATGRLAPANPDGTSHFATCPDAASWRQNRG